MNFHLSSAQRQCSRNSCRHSNDANSHWRLHNKVISFKVLYQVISILKLLLKRELSWEKPQTMLTSSSFYGISDKEENNEQANKRAKEWIVVKRNDSATELNSIIENYYCGKGEQRERTSKAITYVNSEFQFFCATRLLCYRNKHKRTREWISWHDHNDPNSQRKEKSKEEKGKRSNLSRKFRLFFSECSLTVLA